MGLFDARRRSDDIFGNVVASIAGETDSQAGRLRIAAYCTLPFVRRALEPLVALLDGALLTHDRQAALAFRPDVLVVATEQDILLVRDHCARHHVLLVAMRHGVGCKYIRTPREYGDADYLAGSAFDRRDMERVGVLPRRGFLATGNPWADDTFRLPVRAIDRRRPTILFAPTWNPEVSAAAFFEGQLVAWIRAVYPESRIVIRPHPNIVTFAHPLMRQFEARFAAWLETWRRLAREEPHVELAEDPAASIAGFFAGADLLISDGSSLVYEFMALERPILLYSSGETVVEGELDPLALANRWRDVALEFRTPEEFRAALERVFDDHAYRARARQAACSAELFGEERDGRAVERLASALRELPRLEALVIAPRLDDELRRWFAHAQEQLRATRWFCALTEPRDVSASWPAGVSPFGAQGTTVESLRRSFLGASASGYALVVLDPARERLEDASFVSRALARMREDRRLGCCCGPEGPDGSYALFAREATSSGAAAGEPEVAQIWDDEPRLCYGDGFYPPEDGWRWMAKRAQLRLEQTVRRADRPGGYLLEVELRSSDHRHYGSFPVCATVSVSGQRVGVVSFVGGWQAISLRLTVPVERLEAPTVEFRADQAFVPKELGFGEDPRRLSIQVRVTRVAASDARERREAG